MNIPFSPYDFFGYLASGFLVLLGMEFTLGFPPILGHAFTAVESAALLMAAYVAGQMIAAPSKALLEDRLVGKVLGRPNVNLFLERKPRVRGFIFPGFYEPLPPQTRAKLLERLRGEGVLGMGEDLFLHVRFSPSVRQDAKLAERLGGFLNLYGFNRNLCFSALVVGLAMLAAAKYLPTAKPELWHYGSTILIAAVILFYRYLKFFRQYSYELFNTYGGGT